MFFKQLTKRENVLFGLTLLTILFFLAYAYVVEPIRGCFHCLDRQILTKEIQVRKNQKMLSKKENVLGEYERFADQLKSNGSLEEEMAATLREIEIIAEKTNLYLVDIKPQPIKNMAFYKKLVVVVEGEGRIADLTKFIYELSSSPQVLKVQKLRLKAKSENSSILESQLVISRITGG